MSKFDNKRRQVFLSSVNVTSIDDDSDDLTVRSKFNFSYFDVQDAGQAFGDWNKEDLVELLGKLKEYSRQPLSYWRNQSVGASGAILSVYSTFPTNSQFKFPRHVPHQAQWARFRLKQAVRLVGFVVPGARHGESHRITGERFDSNVFYVVFLDAKHKFWVTEKK